ncbi:MAG: hypothetical protein KA144_11220 [Xanthomonadaceae bacterium]|nr:hypothetical protein [Xanthomonadaceae bacterium]
MSQSIDDKGHLRGLLTDGVLIALVTGCVYLTAFYYEYGYCDYFGIPKYLIVPSTTTLLISAAGLGAFLFSCSQLIVFLMPLLAKADEKSKSGNPFGTLLFHIFFLALIGVLLFVAYGYSRAGFVSYILLCAFLLFFNFGIHFLPFFGKGTLNDRMKEAEKAADENPFDISKYILEKFGKGGLLVFLLSISIFPISYIVGNGEAAKQVRFLALSEKPNFVVLRAYGESFVSVQVDPKTKSIGKNYIISRFSQSLPSQFVEVNIGPLTKKRDVQKSKQALPA